MLPESLLNSDDDWIESLRKYFYPKLHNPLSKFGDRIGINLYSTGRVGWNQYVGDLEEEEEVIEKEITKIGGQRNPVACLKQLPDGRTSEGSWVLLHDDLPEVIKPGMQLHMTLFNSDLDNGREVYAHYEDDWRTAPLAHLRAKNFDIPRGVGMAKQIFNDSTFLLIDDE